MENNLKNISSIESERILLASLISLQNDSMYDSVFSRLKDTDFVSEIHQSLFNLLKNMFNNRIDINLSTIIEELKKENSSQISKQFLLELLTIIPAKSIYTHINLIKEKSLLRTFVLIQQDLIIKANSGYQLKDLIDETEKNINSISDKAIKKNLTHINDDLDKVLREIMSNSDKDKKIVKTYTKLDDLIGGFDRTNLILIAARPSVGKTAYSLNLLLNQALQGKHVVFFSLEMSKDLLIQRLLYNYCEIESNKVATNSMTNLEYNKIKDSLNVISNLPIYLNDDPYMNFYQIKSECRRLKKQNKLDIIYIDYIQLLVNHSDKYVKVHNQIATITLQLIQLAKELQIPVVLLCQLNRAIEGRENKIPNLSDLRDSGSLEQSADVILFLHRQDYYSKKKYYTDEEEAEIFIAKNRNGVVGSVKMIFEKKFMRFVDCE